MNKFLDNFGDNFEGFFSGFFFQILILHGILFLFVSRSNTSRYECAVKSLGILIIIGISWIVGFMTRWGVHHYYIDSIGKKYYERSLG